MTRTTRIRPSESGFNIQELRITCGIIIVIAAVALPFLLTTKGRIDDNRECIRNLVAFTRGAKIGDAKCPAADLPYTVREEENVRDVACPDPEKHIPTVPRVRLKNGKWSFHQKLSGIEMKPGVPVEVSDGWFTLATTVTAHPDRTVVEVRRPWLVLYIILPIVMLLIVGMAVGAVGDSLREGKVQTVVVTVFMLGIALLFLYWIGNEDTYVFRPGGTVEIHDSCLGVTIFSPETISGIVALAPGDTGGTVPVVVYYEEAGEIVFDELFSIHTEELGALAPAHKVLFGVDP